MTWPVPTLQCGRRGAVRATLAVDPARPRPFHIPLAARVRPSGSPAAPVPVADARRWPPARAPCQCALYHLVCDAIQAPTVQQTLRNSGCNLDALDDESQQNAARSEDN